MISFHGKNYDVFIAPIKIIYWILICIQWLQEVVANHSDDDAIIISKHSLTVTYQYKGIYGNLLNTFLQLLFFSRFLRTPFTEVHPQLIFINFPACLNPLCSGSCVFSDIVWLSVPADAVTRQKQRFPLCAYIPQEKSPRMRRWDPEPGAFTLTTISPGDISTCPNKYRGEHWYTPIELYARCGLITNPLQLASQTLLKRLT